MNNLPYCAALSAEYDVLATACLTLACNNEASKIQIWSPFSAST